MTIIIEDTEDIPCSHCAQMRKSFIMIAASAVLPMVVFSAVLLLLTASNGDDLETSTSVIVEFVLGLLYVQLFVAASVVITSFVKRRHPVMKYHIWYLAFHVFSMGLFLASSLMMTLVNESYLLSAAVFVAGVVYFYILYYFFKVKSFGWCAIRRAY